MNKIAVIFWTGTGNTEIMANEVVAGASAAGAEVTLFNTSAFKVEKAQEFDKFALGCPAMGAEELEDSEFQPLYDQLKTQISGKKVVLFGSYGWGDGEWMRDWVQRMEDAGATVYGGEAAIYMNEPDGAEDDLKALGKELASL